MEIEWRTVRSIRRALVGLANGVALVFLAVLVAAYGSGTAVPFGSVEEFLRVATVWAQGPRGPTLAWALGYLGLAVFVLSPVWFLLVGPAVRGRLDLRFSTAPVEPHEADEGTDRSETGGTRATTVDEPETGVVRGGAAGGDAGNFSLEDSSGEEESGRSGGGD